MRKSTPEEINEHLRMLRRRLAGQQWSLAQMAEVVGVAKQTFSQYCMLPSTRGSRTIPAAGLDALRTAATELWSESTERGFPSWLDRNQHLWSVFDADLALALETTFVTRAEWHAARIGGTVLHGPGNANQSRRRLSADEELCVEWLSYLHGGLVTRDDAMEIAEVDDYLIERVGHEFPGWRIQPTADQVHRIRDLHERRWRDAA